MFENSNALEQQSITSVVGKLTKTFLDRRGDDDYSQAYYEDRCDPTPVN